MALDGVEAATSPSEVPLRVSFQARVGAEVFACGASFAGVGSPPVTFTPSDLRLYVHDFELIRADGSVEPVAFMPDGRWQLEDVALLDFEDRTGPCRNGTSDTRTFVMLEAPSAPFVGLRFSVGVPFARNHQNAALAPSPLNLTAMFWSWSTGYKFLRLEGRVGETGSLRVHVGSVGCAADMNGTVESCLAPNRARVELAAFDPALDTVVFDVGALLAGSTFEQGVPGAGGCMGRYSDPGCTPIFERLGIDGHGEATAAQRVFRAAR